jgi:hypothetical protein
LLLNDLNLSVSYECTQENLKLAREAILEVATLWAGFVRQARQQQQEGHPFQDDPEVRAYDARYVQCEYEPVLAQNCNCSWPQLPLVSSPRGEEAGCCGVMVKCRNSPC